MERTFPALDPGDDRARQRFTRAVAALAGVLMLLATGTLFSGLFDRLKPDWIRPPAASFATWIDPQSPEFPIGNIRFYLCPTDATVNSPAIGPSDEPAETPLLPPSGEQLVEIQERLQ